MTSGSKAEEQSMYIYGVFYIYLSSPYTLIHVEKFYNGAEIKILAE